MQRLLIATVSVLGFCTLAHAEQPASIIQSCDAALVKATYNEVEFDYADWRMAEKVDQASYDQSKTDIGANATIYGVPVGATYGDFQQNIQTLKRAGVLHVGEIPKHRLDGSRRPPVSALPRSP
ncbi:hypothetical protein G6321_00010290 [Bradyrhizobium barranii subsp. barranii]|uniref:Uncharacterized protein n=1 Tax=Bradyrhizobium barranii subsp. barranii TaxID=2823807 RepID=A0A7Z0Q5W0_9BRAD|nr:hypothetical protein [Bradyrhizobium barranii]UGX95498.1 hypothetical protein G6321_00010290 [Bradyrhizobium barranii subsp. barranii]